MTATLASVIAPMTRLCFAMHDRKKPDSENVQAKDSKPEKRRRMRLHFKGPLAFEDAEPIKYNFSHLRARGANAVAQLWQGLKETDRSVFNVAISFWPPAQPKAEMFQEVMEDCLRNIAAVKWRLQCRWVQPPYSLCFLDSFASVECVPQDIMQRAVLHVVSASDCCLDPFWARPVQKLVTEANDTDKGKILFGFVKQFFGPGFRCASLKEERRHSIQRKLAGGHVSMVRSFGQQASQSLISDLTTAFFSMGGRDLKKAPVSVLKAARHVRVRRTIRKRPRQTGSPMFYFASKQRGLGSEASPAELYQQWKDLPAQTKTQWRDLHKGEVRRNRHSISAPAAEAQVQSAQDEVKTLWGVGDKSWPLKEATLEAFLKPFRTRGSGIEALQKFAGTDPIFEHEKACAEYAKNVQDGKTKYHSMVAAGTACKAITLAKITKETVGSTAKDIMKTACPQHHCASKHPGLCRTRHAAKTGSVFSLCKSLPKENCVLRCETTPSRNKKVVYVKATIGQADLTTGSDGWGLTVFKRSPSPNLLEG